MKRYLHCLRWVVLPILFRVVVPAQAHNGQMAIAVPVEGIAIDGDLSDWPADMTSYPILLPEFGVRPEDEQDFQASFRMGYNERENALYVAVEVQDESIVIDTSSEAAWNTQDGCEVYVDVGHGEGDALFSQFNLHGHSRSALGSGGRLEALEAEVRREGNTHRYEWKIDIEGMSDGRVLLAANMALGIDVVVEDKDEDGSFSWMAWGKRGNKRLSPNRRGDVLLLERDATLEKALPLLRNLIEKTVNSTINSTINSTRIATSYQVFFTAVPLAFAVIHLFLFMFYPQARDNLYYAINTTGIAGLLYSTTENSLWLFKIGLLIVCVSGIRLVYDFLYPKAPRVFWLLLVSAVIMGLFSWYIPTTYFHILALLTMLEMWRIFYVAFGKKKMRKEKMERMEGMPPFWIGFLPLCFLAVYSALAGLDVIEWWAVISNYGFGFAILSMLLSMSLYLARGFAKTNTDLEAQLVQVKELSAKALEQEHRIREEEVQRKLHQEANRLKSDFLARMSHDLRTPMNAIIGYTRILLRQAKEILSERQYRNLDNIQISANNLLSLINDILDLSKIEAGRIDIKPEAVDLKQLTTECIVSVASLVKPGVQLELQLADASPVHTDADRIRRVVMNLLSNALKFTEQGSITVSAKPVDGGMELSVADTGSGIPPKDLPHIFDEFRQVEGQEGVQQEGTGLGLSIAKKSVELLGGTISVESEVGKGTKFTLRITDYEERNVE